MNLLVDTHIWLWWMEQSSRLPDSAYRLVNNPNNQVAVSSISLFELNIKSQIGKLKINGDIVETSQSQGLKFLSFTPEHAAQVIALALHHKDPFDRALLAQARAENLVFLTVDENLRPYEKDVRMMLV